MTDDPRRPDDSNDDAVRNHDLCSHQVGRDDHGAHGIRCRSRDRCARFHASRRSPFLQECRRRGTVSGSLTCLPVVQLVRSAKEFFISWNLFCGGACPESGTVYPKDGSGDSHQYACQLWLCRNFVSWCCGAENDFAREKSGAAAGFACGQSLGLVL